MFKITKFIPVLILAVGVHAADTLNVFRAGDTAKAVDVNANFKFLSDRLNSINQENQALKKFVDSLKATKPIVVNVDSINLKMTGLNFQITALGTKIDSINMKLVISSNSAGAQSKRIDSLNTRSTDIENRLFVFPKGSIVASMMEPASDVYLPNSDNTWILAAGQGTVNGVVIPDLRGVFLRGIDYTLSGRPATGRDSSTTRTPGNYQGDLLVRHSHKYNTLKEAVEVLNSPGSLYKVADKNFPTDQPTDSIGGLETRPKNVATYFFIKVK